MTDQKTIDYLDQFCVKAGNVEVKAINIRNGTCSIVVPVFNGAEEFFPNQIATLDFEFDFDGEDVTIYKFPKRLLSDEDRIFVEGEIADEFSLSADKISLKEEDNINDKIVLDFGNIVSEMENKGLKLLTVKDNNSLFVVDDKDNLYVIEPYYAGGYLDRFIGERNVISFEHIEQPSRNFEDWRKEFLDATWVNDFIDRVVKKEYPGFKTSSLEAQIQSAADDAADARSDDLLNLIDKWIDKSKITDSARISVFWDSYGIAVDFNYSYDESLGYGESVLCFAETYEDGMPDETSWKEAQDVGLALKNKYNLPLDIAKSEAFIASMRSSLDAQIHAASSRAAESQSSVKSIAKETTPVR